VRDVETLMEALERTADALSSSINGVFADLEKIADRVTAAAEAAAGVPRRAEYLFLKQDLADIIELHSDLIIGAGIAYAPGSLPEAPHWLEWWRAQPKGGPRFVTHDLNPDSLNYYDYTSREWFTLPSSTGQPVAVGPYVDFGGINVNIITLCVPAHTPQGIHVLGCDLPLAKLEGVFLRALLNIVTGSGRVTGNRISEHPDVDLVAITGSVGSGQKVAANAANTVKRVHLELGGKAPVLVFADADLEAAAKGVRSAGFWNGGQECGSACRVLVHESVAEKFTELLVREVSEITVGSPGAGNDVEIGSMISKAHYQRVLAALDDARKDGLTIAVGGNAIDGPGYFIEPTVVTDVPAGAPITSTEIFGPVVSVETFSTDEEAITRANETVYGLAASVWTTDSARSLSAPRWLDFGTVWVNSHLVIANEMPWGGFKGSGYGRDLSVYALEDFSRTKHVMYNHG
jgi:hypothetical protein